MTKKILLITEGKDEKKLFNKLLKKFSKQKVEIVQFRTNIYQLFTSLESYNCDYKDLEITQVLIEQCKNLTTAEKQILTQTYSEIFLIFDFDPHDPLYNENKIIKLNEHFVDSSDYGKLYINYPMVESFYHIDRDHYIKSIPDENFKLSTFNIRDLTGYKKDVGMKGFALNDNDSKYTVAFAIEQHISKFKSIIEITDSDVFLHEHLRDFLIAQCTKLRNTKEAFIVNTSCFAILELYEKSLNEALSNG